MLDLPVRAGVRYSGLIDVDVIFIVELSHVIVHDNGVRYSKAMDDIKEEQHGLLGLDPGDWSGLYLLYKLVYGDK